VKGFRDAALASALNMALIIGFLCLAVWWIQTNFGALSALATVGGALGAGLLYLGVRIGGNLVTGAHRDALENFTASHASVEETRGRYAAVQREYARQDREQLAAYAKFQMIDVQDSRRLARQQAGLLVDLERQKWEQQAQQAQPAAAWAMDDDNDGAGVRYYE
jgi:hypothetical protein